MTKTNINTPRSNKFLNLLRQLLKNLPGKLAGLLGRLQRQPGRVYKTVKTRVPIARSRKALLFFSGVLIILVPITYLILKNPKEIKAATVELSTTSNTVQIDVANRYRAIMETDDSWNYLIFKDRMENDGSPDSILEFESTAALRDENTWYSLNQHENRTTTILESTSTRVKVRVEGCLDTNVGGQCLTDGTDDVTVIQEITFTNEGAFIHVEYDFHSKGITLDTTEYSDELRTVGTWYFNNSDAPSAYSETVLYGDGETASSRGTDGAMNGDNDGYIVAQATGNYQDIIFGTLNLDGDKILSNSSDGEDWLDVNESAEREEVRLYEIATQTLRGKGSAQFFIQFHDQGDLDTEAEREALFNDLTNPDYLSHTVGELWDNKPSGDFLFASGFEGGDSNLCDGGDGWTNGTCETGNTALGNNSSTVYNGNYSAKFTSTGTNDTARTYVDFVTGYSRLYGRLNILLDYQDLVDYGQISILQFQESSENQTNYFGISKRPDGDLELFGSANGSTTLAGDDGNIQLDTWYEIEFTFYRHPTNGTLDLWLDGNHILSVTSAYTGDYDMHYFMVGINTADSNNNQIFIDNVIVSESYIGTSHYNEIEGTYTTNMLASEIEIDIDAGVNSSTLVDNGSGVEAGDTSITVDSTTGFPSSGVAYIEGDKFSYTGTTVTTFTGIPSTGELSIIGHADNSVVSLSQRHTPLYKLRNYRKNDAPQSITLEKDTLTLGAEYNASVKPFTTSYFAQDLVWHSTMEGTSAVTSSDVGSGGVECVTPPSYTTGKYGNGVLFDEDGECLYFPTSSNFDKAIGAIEFWYQPASAHNDSGDHYFLQIYADSNDYFRFYKASSNNLVFVIEANGTKSDVVISSSNYSWSPGDWVHLRIAWDDTDPSTETQLKVYVNGKEPTHTHPNSNDYISNNLTLGTNLNISISSAGYHADGIIDEFRVYDFNGSGDRAELAKLSVGGNGADSNEYLADPTNDYTFDFNNDDADNRGEYLWLGTDAPFGGVNMDLATDGVGSSEDFDWEYWDGASWTALTVTEQDSGSASFTGDGNFYFTPPADWFPYSVNGSTDLYYIRGHLEDGSYSTDPMENRIKTDILLLHYQDNIIEENQTLHIPATTSGSNPPVLYWALNQGYGTTANDSSDHNNDGTISGATWQPQDLCYSEKCLYFDGSNDEILRSDDPQLDSDENTSFTIQAWIRHPDISTNPDVIAAKFESTGGDGGYRIQMESDGDISFGIDDENTSFPEDSVTSTSADYDDNNWHHVTAVKDTTSSIKLYIDGEFIDEDNTISADTSLENNDDFYIGIDGDGSSNAWSGFIDEIKVYRYARSAEEIKTDYAAKGSEKGAASVLGQRDYSFLSKGLVGYWKMDDAGVDSEGETSTDSSGNGNDTTLYGDNSVGDNGSGMDCTAGGKYGTGCDFDGSDDYIKNTSPSNLTSSQGSIALWVKSDIVDWENHDFLFLWEDEGWDYLLVRKHWDRTFRIFIKDDNSYILDVETTETLADDTDWHHVVFTQDGGGVKIYVDGESKSLTENAQSSAWSNHLSPQALLIGGTDVYSDWDGLIDEVRVYNRALSPAEVSALYHWAPGPVAYFPFDEGIGTSTVFDKSGNGFSGTMNGSMTESDWVPGKFGSALNFDGTNDSVVVGDISSKLDLISTDPPSFTYSAWMKAEASCPDGAGLKLVYVGGSGEGRLFYRPTTCAGAPCFGFQLKSGSTVSYTQNNTVTPNNWYHVTGTYDQPTHTISIYLNGVLHDSDVAADYDLSGSGPMNMTIGYDQWYFKGGIDEVRVYDYVRTQEQIIEDMNAGHPPVGTPIGSAVGYWKFDESYGDTANDSSPQGNDGNLAGASTCPGHTFCPSWSNSGKFDKALHFDGSDDVVSVPHSTSYKPEDEITITGWFNADDWDSTFDITATGNTQMRLFTATGGGYQHPSIQLDFDSTGTKTAQWANQTISAGEWHHIAGVYDGTNLILYFNGMARKTTYVGSDTIDQDTGSLLIGQHGTDNADGLIDEVKIYNFALTPDQIKADMNQASSAVWGAVSTDGSGDASWAASAEYCVPGDTSTCDPPIGHWKFDEKTGQSAYDTSGNGHTATLGSSGGTDTNDPTWTHAGECKKGTCLKYDGTDNYVQINDSDSLDANLTNFSASFWMYKNTQKDYDLILSKMNDVDTDGSYGFQFDNTAPKRKLSFKLRSDSDNGGVVSLSGLNTGQWYYVVGTWDGSNIRFYINGVLQGTSPVVGSNVKDTAFNLTYAIASNLQPPYFDGLIDDVRIYDYARTPAQIAWEYNKGGPVGHWQLDECEGTTAYDVSGNGNNGTITIDGLGDYTSAGTCASGVGTEAWNAGTNGKRNASLGLDGSGDVILIGDDDSFNVEEEITISAWIYWHGHTGDTNYIFDADQKYLFHLIEAAKLNFDFQSGFSWQGGAGTIWNSSGTITQNTWTHVAVTYDSSLGSGNVRFYINGELDANTYDETDTIDDPADDIAIANYHDGPATTFGFDGQVDDVRIYNYALTQDQIKGVINEGSIRFGPDEGSP